MNDRKLDMSLDDIIRMEGIKGARKFSSGRRGFGSGRGFGSARGRRVNNQDNNNINPPTSFRSGGFRGRNRPMPYQRRSPIGGNNPSSSSSFRSQGVRRAPTVAHISNLAPTVTSDDLKELFNSFGNVNRAFVHYNQFAQSLGTGEVEFERKDEAIAARNKYNNVPLDGKPMKITLINISDDDSFTLVLKNSSSSSNQRRFGGNYNNNRNNRFNNSNNDNNNRNNRRINLTADDLDRDLDEWRSKQNGSAGDSDVKMENITI